MWQARVHTPDVEYERQKARRADGKSNKVHKHLKQEPKHCFIDLYYEEIFNYIFFFYTRRV